MKVAKRKERGKNKVGPNSLLSFPKSNFTAGHLKKSIICLKTMEDFPKGNHSEFLQDKIICKHKVSRSHLCHFLMSVSPKGFFLSLFLEKGKSMDKEVTFLEKRPFSGL